MDDIAIKVDAVYKDFKLPHEQTGSIKSFFTSRIKHIHKDKGYEIQHALKDISFEIKRGEFFGIVGRNGSGKSTLLKMLAGIYQPNKGNISVSGRLVPFIELGVGFNSELTGRENIYLNGAMLGFTKKEIDDRYDDIVEFAELEKFMDQKLKNYSSGMQVRLAFSLAIRAETDILLVDEVLAVGDADFQRKCFRYFKKLKKEKKTVVFVTHDMNAVREYCDRAAFIEKSELVDIGEPDVIARQYEKLLMPKSEGTQDDVIAKERWGDGTLTIEKPKLEKLDKNTIEVSMDVKAHKDCDDPIYGFVFKNGSGNALAGSNSLLEKAKSTPLKAGDIKKVRWSFANVYPDGDYSLTLGVLYDSGATTADWQEDILSLTIARASHTPYLTAPNVELIIK
jgi:ABC-2 type transport system ATP-binding protein